MPLRLDRVWFVAGFLLWGLALTPNALASPLYQAVGTTTGAIAGRVSDATGAALPGTTVTLSGAPLMQARLTTSGPDGHFRFTALAPGEYVLTFEHAGFRRTSSEPVRVGAGFTATVDAVMPVAGVAERVTVERRSGVIDRHSTALAVNVDDRQLANTPGSRSLFAILSSTPGIHVQRFEVGGNTGDAGGPYAAYGTPGLNRPMVEGISVAQIFPTGFTLDFGAFEEVSVGLASHSAEWPLPGVQMQFVARSGGNEYHGSVYGGFQHRNWQSFNIDEGQQRRGLESGATPLSREANRLWKSHDLNAGLGGFIARNRAWWYGSIRDQEVELRQLNFPVKPSRTRLTNTTVKATFNLNTQHRFVGFAQTGRNDQPNRLDPFGPTGALTFNAANAIHESEDATSTRHGSGIVWKAEWNASFGNALFAEARAGAFFAKRRLTPNGEGSRFEDIDTLQVSGGGRHTEAVLRRPQVHAAVSYFRRDHQLKFGVEASETLTEDRVHTSFPGDVLHVLRNGFPAEVYLFLPPSESLSGMFAAGAHAADIWRVNERLTLNLGLRFDRYRVFLPAQAHPAGGPDGGPVTFAAVDDVVTWNRVAPRAGGAFDLLGDRSTIVKASFNRYWIAPADLGPNVNPNAAEWWRRYTWRDLNGSGLWDPGEQNQQIAGRGGFALESIDPGLRSRRFDELTTAVERELPAGLGLRTAVVWRRDANRYARQNLARPFEGFTERVAIVDPGPDGVSGTGDDGSTITGYNLSLDRPRVSGNVVRTVENSRSRYTTWDITLNRRWRDGWSLAGGFSHTWHAEHANAYTGQVVRQNAFVLTPNDLVNTENGRHVFRTWTATLSGTFDAPWKLTISPLLRHQSGQPYGRTFSTVMNFGPIRMLAEPIGTRRMDNVTLFDVHVERELAKFGGIRAAVFVDVFNAFNANPEQNINWSSGPGFLQPLTVVAPRIARVGATVSF